jgi:hypothetical protein
MLYSYYSIYDLLHTKLKTKKMSKEERNITETPDRWIVIKISRAGDIYHKIFASWDGGYLDGDRWKMNSGIASLEEEGDYYYFIGYSGSCYKCHKKGYGVMTSYSQSILDNMIDKASEIAASISVLLDDTNFMELLNQNKDGKYKKY